MTDHKPNLATNVAKSGRTVEAAQSDDCVRPFPTTLEALADLEHRQWQSWAQHLIATKAVKKAKAESWQKYLKPYDALDESAKDLDREWARKALALVDGYRNGATGPAALHIDTVARWTDTAQGRSVPHLGIHVGKSTLQALIPVLASIGKALGQIESSEHPGEMTEADWRDFDTKRVPDLVILAAMLAKARGLDLNEAVRRRSAVVAQ